MADDAKENVELATNNSGLSIKTLIIILSVVVVLIAGSIGLTVYFLSGDKSSSKNAKNSEQLDVIEFEAKPAIYFLLKPDFVINFESDGKANFLSVQLEIMARTDQPIEIVQSNMPVIRNNILLLLSAQKYETIRKVAGKKQLRADILDIMNQVILDESNSTETDDEEQGDKSKQPEEDGIEKIEAVYFTGFIMQ